MGAFTNFSQYRKFWVAVIGAVIIGADSFFNITLGFGPDGVVQLIEGLIAAVFVNAVPNKA